MESKSLKIGYVVKRFPRVSEAFIANEIRELEREGVTIQIYAFVDPLAEEGSTVVHGVVRELAAEVTYIPTRQTMKRWPVKQGCFGAGEFVERPWREPHAAAVVSESTDFLQAGFVATLARADGVQHLHAHFSGGGHNRLPRQSIDRDTILVHGTREGRFPSERGSRLVATENPRSAIRGDGF